MQAVPEIQFQISLLNMVSFGRASEQAEQLEDLIEDQQLTVEKR